MKRAGLWAIALLLAAPVRADPEEADRKVAEMIEKAREVYGVRDPRAKCRPSADSEEIVVCADHGEDQRVPSTSQSDPNSREAQQTLDNGVPRAPQLDRGSCKGKPGCVTGGWAPPPVYYIDMKAIPEPAEGSDADRIAKGELPDR